MFLSLQSWMAPGGRQIYKQANKPDNFRVTATTKETKWNNVRGGQGTTLNEMVKEGLPEEATIESSMTGKCQMGEEFGRIISRRGNMQVQRPWGRYELYMLLKNRGNLVAQLVKNLPAMQETWVRSLGWEDPLGKGHPLQYSDLENSVDCIVHGVAKSQTRLSIWHVLVNRRKSLILLNFIGHSEHSGYYSRTVLFHGKVYVWE